MFKQTFSMPDIQTNSNKKTLEEVIQSCISSKYNSIHKYSKVKQIDFELINKLNTYLKQIIDTDITITSICKINDGKSAGINYSETNIYNTNYIDHNMIKSSHRK
jgi:hypothetical protein